MMILSISGGAAVLIVGGTALINYSGAFHGSETPLNLAFGLASILLGGIMLGVAIRATSDQTAAATND